MNKKNVVICSVLGLVFVIATIMVVLCSNFEDKYAWLSSVTFFLPYLFDFIIGQLKKHSPYKKWYKSWKDIKTELNPSRIRISFSYLYRIKVDDKYFLIKNAHGTDLFQPVGGVYKYCSDAEAKLMKLGAVDDEGEVIKLDSTTKNDFRLRVETKKLPRFVKWFQKEEFRETVHNLSREFKEELLDSGILQKEIFEQMQYTYVGQHISDICTAKYDSSLYELFIADIVELNATTEQYQAIKDLQNKESEQYCFATEKMILSNKTSQGPDKNKIDIADHSFKILDVTEDQLDKRKFEKYTVRAYLR